MADPMTPEQLAGIRVRLDRITAADDDWTLGDYHARDLLAEVERLRAERAVDREQREITRAQLAAFLPPGALSAGETPALCGTCTEWLCVPGLAGCARCVSAEAERLRADLEGHRQALIQAIGAPDLPWQVLLNRTRIDYAALIRQRDQWAEKFGRALAQRETACSQLTEQHARHAELVAEMQRTRKAADDAHAQLDRVLTNYRELQGEAIRLESERDDARLKAGQLREEAQTQGRLRRAEHRDAQQLRTRANKAETELAEIRRRDETSRGVSHAIAQRNAVALAAEKEWERHGEEIAAWERTLAETVAERDQQRVRADNWEHLAGVRNEQSDDAMRSRDRARAERDQLRYERTLLGAARALLDRIATGGLRGWAEALREAEDLAQRIVDEIGHPVTGEPALGPSYRDQITQLRGLAEEALHLRMHGEHAPGGTETWAEWDRRAETVLRDQAAAEESRG